MLEVKSLVAGYAGSEVLHGIDLVVEDGEGVVVLGPNGHGKTTLLRAITGLLPPRSGAVFLEGREITRWRADVIAAAGIVHIPQGDLLFPEMTVLENLLMGAYLRDDKDRIAEDLDRVYAMFPILAERRRQDAGTLSGGEQQMLAIGRALMSRPKLIMFDEPSLGLAPNIVERTFDIITGIRDAGTTVLMVEQNASAALDMCDHAYLLESGLLALSGPGRELIDNPHVRSAYLAG